MEKIGNLLLSDNAEVQCAAAVVIGELRPKEPSVRKALCEALERSGDSVKPYILDAIARMGVVEAVPKILPLLSGSSPVRSKAVDVVRSFGPAVLKTLEAKLALAADGAVRMGILDVIGSVTGPESAEMLLQSLFDKDPDVVKQTVAVIKNKTEEMGDDDRKRFRATLLKFMATGRVRKDKNVVISCLKVCGSLKSPEMVKTLLAHTGKREPPLVRNNALFSLSMIDYGSMANHDALARRIFPFLAEDDLAVIVSPALNILWKLRIGRSHASTINKLLKSPHETVRLFAIKALGNLGAGDAAAKLIEALNDADQKTHEMASAALRSNRAFIPAIVRELKKTSDITRAWKLANALKAHAVALDKKTVRDFLTRCLKLLEKNESGFQVFYEILRGADPATLREMLLRRGRDLLRAKKYDQAQRFLALLEREGLSSNETEYALAISGLLLARKDLAMAGRDRNHAFDLFARLIKRGSFDPLKALRADLKLFTPADLLYLGFHFIERMGPEREFGADVLKLTAQKFAKSAEGKTAKRKLHSEGL